MLNLILKDFHLVENEILMIYPYGSRVYKTNSELSDYDFIIVLNKEIREYALSSNDEKLNIHLYDTSGFQDQLNQHKISALECLFLPENLLLKNNHKFNFTLNKAKLRSSISEKASHSFVKAKKKFEIPAYRDVYIAKKSLFHSLRIIDFGAQIAKYDKIIDYSSSNYLWDEIKNNEAEDWDTYKNKYHELFNSKMTEFRKLAPKVLNG